MVISLTARALVDYRRLSALFVAGTCAIACAAFAQTQQPPSFEAQVEARTIALTNEYRAQQSLAALTPESRLTDAARAFAAYIAQTDKLDHDADGTTPPERLKKRGYSFCMVAENLASEFDTRGFTVEALSRRFVKGWSESATHRANMLEADVTEIGVGVERNPRSGEYYAVQVFARPTSQVVKFRVANRTNATIRYEFRKRSVALAPKQSRTHESCAGGDVNLDSSGTAVPLRPKDGGRYAVVQEKGGIYRWAEE